MLLSALALGAAATLALAIACGLTLEPPYGLDIGYVATSRAFILGGRPWIITEWRRAGASLLLWDELYPEFFAAPSSTTAAPATKVRQDQAQLIRDFYASRDASESRMSNPVPHVLRLNHPPHWGQFATGHAPPPPANDDAPDEWQIGADIGYGWPCIALWYQANGYWKGNGAFTTDSNGAGVIKGQPKVRGRVSCRVVPLRPAWRGLAANTLAFSALWWALLVGPAALRQALRRRRGQCQHCGYDLRATSPQTPCPECGKLPTRVPGQESQEGRRAPFAPAEQKAPDHKG